MLPKWLSLSLEAIKWLVATLAIPLTLGYISQQYAKSQTELQASYARVQAERQDTEARLRLYTELLSKREEADTGVRKGIFDKVLEIYLKPEAQGLEAKFVALELLALNFNDSLDLSPLFWQLDREIQQLGQMAKRSSMMEQLLRIANEIKRRQMEVLQLSGGIVERNVELLEKEAALTRPIDQKISFSDLDPSAPKDQKLVRHFKVEAAEHDPVGHRILVFLTHSTDVEGEDRLLGFWVDLFDFPLTNFTRISKSERFTVLLTRYSPPTAQLTLIYFPSSRSGVKDKPFIDEVISDLRRDLK